MERKAFIPDDGRNIAVTEKLREAIITEKKKILCPYCYKINGELTGRETIRNFRVRCRGSGGRLEHFFMLNVETEEKRND